MARIAALPEDSAWRRKHSQGHTSLHELLAQIRDATVTTAHGWRLDGKPSVYPRPQLAEQPAGLDLADPDQAAQIRRFFATPR